MHKLYSLLFLFLTSLTVFGNTITIGKSSLSGIVLDEKSQNPVEYASVSIYHSADSSLITGVITNQAGVFIIEDLSEGNYYLMISFLGYTNKSLGGIELLKNEQKNVGTIQLKMDSQLLGEVEITSDFASVEYQIDRKVIDVDQQLTTASMSAVEVLENVPSINVDIDGNVSLRGSSGFTVLIDGKPTALEPSEALRQISASSILNIEVITNPSSKYVPDGNGGIINIILKKNRNNGLNGLVTVQGGSFKSYGANTLVNYKRGKSNFFIAMDTRKNISPSTNQSERRTSYNDTITLIVSDGTGERNRTGWSIRSGWDWDPNDKNSLSISTTVGNHQSYGFSNAIYQTSIIPGDVFITENSVGDWYRGGDYLNATSNFTHQFKKEEEEVSFQYNFRYRNPEEYSESLLYGEPKEVIINGTGITEVGPSNGSNIRVDYTNLLKDKSTIEIGTQIRLSESNDRIEIQPFDSVAQTLVLQEGLGNDIKYNRGIYGLYGVWKGEKKKLGYQFGLRGEYMDRSFSSNNSGVSSSISRMDYFPTVHFSYKLPKEGQVMASYGRRIDRPRGWNLEPFVTWTDLFNVRQGNPDLLPEYIHSMDLNYVKNLKKIRFSMETYYRITENRINRVTSVYQEGVLLTRFNNVGKDYALGMETMINWKVNKWWEMNLTGSTYDYRIVGSLDGVDFSNQSFNWNGRLSSSFKLTKLIKLQLDGRYNSPSATSQGRSLEFYTVNGGLRSDFMDRKLSVSVQVRDIFRTARRTSIIESADLYNYRSQLSNAPVITVNVSYRFNNYKAEKGRNSEDKEDY